MNTPCRLLLSSLVLGLCAIARGQVSVSFEQHNRQTGASTVALSEYVFYATIDGVSGATGGTVSASSGALQATPQNVPDDGDYYEYRATGATLGGFLANYPLSANYTVAVTGSTSGNVVINGPGGLFSDHNPAGALFTITGITGGFWSGSTFYFNPANNASFSVTLNSYSAANPGGNYAWYMSAANSSGGYSQLGEVGDGPVTDGTAFSAPTFTFTRGAALNGGDADDTTYGYSLGSRLDIEAGFFNILGMTDSGLGDGSMQGLVVGNVTSFTLQAIPEPSTYAAIFGGLALVGVAIYRRRRTSV